MASQREQEDKVLAAMSEIRKRFAYKMIAMEYIYEWLGHPFQGEGRTKRVILAERVRAGEFYPFDSNAERRLLEAIDE